MPKMKWIGITGGIATGKSTVSRIIESREYQVVDADQIVHQLMLPGQPVYKSIVDHFGTDVLTPAQTINRNRLGEIIFADPEKRKLLEGFIHPAVQSRVELAKQRLELEGERYAFYDVPLLFENAIAKNFDFVVTVWCSPEQQKERLKRRANLSDEQAQARINAQFPIIQKVKQSHFCFDNSGGETDLILIVNHFCDLLDLNQI